MLQDATPYAGPASPPAAPAAPAAEDACTLTLRLRLWLETSDGVGFGIGRLQLLRATARSGSLKAAAKEMGMSYRAAWGKIKRTEEVLGIALLVKHGGEKSSYQVTEAGRAFLQTYVDWFDAVEAFALARAQAMFSQPVRPFAPSVAPEQNPDV